jgi:hypothetical protein
LSATNSDDGRCLEEFLEAIKAGNENLGTLIVTGASRGIGAAVAKLAGERG